MNWLVITMQIWKSGPYVNQGHETVNCGGQEVKSQETS